MSYAVSIRSSAEKDLADIPAEQYQRVRDALLDLAMNPRPHGCKKLTGREGWRIRVGDYRVIYLVDDTNQKVTIIYIGNRRDIYR